MYYLIKYVGPFGFIKPWTAVRDSETYSQQFLTPSIIEGIEKKLFPGLLNEKKFQRGKIHKIQRHRLSYLQMSEQVETIQARGYNSKKEGFVRPKAVLTRGVLLNPTLWLAFGNKQDAQQAFRQHICLCRNEDILFPELLIQSKKEEFDTDEETFYGYELIFGKSRRSFTVGYNRYNKNRFMYGELRSLGIPVTPFHEHSFAY